MDKDKHVPFLETGGGGDQFSRRLKLFEESYGEE